MKRILLVALFLFLIFQGYAQDPTSVIKGENNSSLSSTYIKSQAKVDLGFEGLGLAYDIKVLPTTTIDLNVGIGGYYSISESSFNYSLNPYKPALFVSANPKYFYNQRQRSAKGKNNNLNSGDYIGIKVKYSSKSTSSQVFSDEVILYNIHWGIQRAISRNILWNAYAGIGYGEEFNSHFGTPYPVLGIKLSYLPFF